MPPGAGERSSKRLCSSKQRAQRRRPDRAVPLLCVIGSTTSRRQAGTQRAVFVREVRAPRCPWNKVERRNGFRRRELMRALRALCCAVAITACLAPGVRADEYTKQTFLT